MNSALILTVMVALIPTTCSHICEYDTCEEAECEEVTEANCQGKIVQNGSMCLGCCDVCYTVLEEGDLCGGPEWTMFVYTECADGLYCDYENGEYNFCRQESVWITMNLQPSSDCENKEGDLCEGPDWTMFVFPDCAEGLYCNYKNGEFGNWSLSSARGVHKSQALLSAKYNRKWTVQKM